MNPVFVSHDGRVLDLTKPKTPTPANPQEDPPLYVIAARAAEKFSTTKKHH